MKDSANTYTILFVEDEIEIRKNYVTYLTMFFKEVYEASDGEEAYKIYEEKKPDILVLDINIPKLSGLELLKKIRQDDTRTKAIMLTAHSDTKLLLEAVELKLTKYLIKPISRKELKDSLTLVILELDEYLDKPNEVLELKDEYFWDYDLKELSTKYEVISLTKKEKKVLSIFAINLHKTLSSDEIIYEVWSEYNEGNLNTLKTLIKNLRRKLPKNSIKNIFGVGYKLDI